MGRRSALLIVVAAVVAAVSLFVAASASAFVYWADSQNNRIGRANNDGTGVNPNFIGGTGPLSFAVAVDASHVYWANQNGNSIGRANIDGSGVNNSFITGIVNPSGLAVNATSIFWSTLEGKIGKAKIDGTGVNKNLVSGLVEPCGVALDSGHVYWAEIASGTPAFIDRAGLDGTSQQLPYVTIPGTSFPCGVTVNSANIFWSEFGIFGGGTRIGRANTNTGTGADASFIGDASGPCGIAVHGPQLYWANAETNTIARANTDGTAVDQSLIATGGNQICGVAVDDLSSPTEPPAPPACCSPPPDQGGGGQAGGGQHSGGAPADATAPQTKILAGPGAKLADGKAKFRLSASEADSVFQCKLGGAALTAKARPCTSPKRYAGLAPGRYVFKAWAIDAAGNRDATPASRSFRVPAA
jgi:hypothetical protein